MPVYEFEGKRPRVGETSFVHPCAVLIGGVTIGENCYIGPGAVLRGDFGYIEIGDGSNVQENVVIHTFPEQTARLEKDSHIGHSAIVHGSKIGENVLVGMGAILHEGVEIGKDCIIGSGCVITANRKIPPGKLVVGVPEKSSETSPRRWPGPRPPEPGSTKPYPADTGNPSNGSLEEGKLESPRVTPRYGTASPFRSRRFFFLRIQFLPDLYPILISAD